MSVCSPDSGERCGVPFRRLADGAEVTCARAPHDERTCHHWEAPRAESEGRRCIPIVAIVPAPGDVCGGTKLVDGEPCKGCRACA